MAKQYGRWKVVESLAQGGQGDVFKVVNTEEQEARQYVLKRLRDSNRLDRFRNEVKAALLLEHRNLVRQIDSDLEGDKPYLVTEYYSGGPLSKADLTAWDTIDLLSLFRSICDGVGYAHAQNVIHRDLKPANIFLCEDGKTPIVGDFGLCFLAEVGERITRTDEAVGARRFTAPELEDGRTGHVDARCDVYSLGKILYWLFSGRVFDREKHREDNWNLTGKYVDLAEWKLAERAFVNELLDQAVVYNPADRFENANHFGANVDRAIWRILHHAHVTDLSEIQICGFCGKGRYRVVADSARGRGPGGEDELPVYGVSRLVGTQWLVLRCENCGHVQVFRTDNLHPNPWELDKRKSGM